MALHFASSSDYLARSAAYLDRASSWTRFLWIRNGSGLPGGYRNYVSDGDVNYSDPYVYIGAGASAVSNTVVVEAYDGSTYLDTPEFTLTDNTWYWVAAVYDSVAHQLLSVSVNS